MVESMDSLDFCAEFATTEKNAIPLDCWNDICLSNIWIPSQLLPNRRKPKSSRETQGIYHTLEKKDFTNYLESFSVYSHSDIESEQGEIFISDSDEDIFDSTNLENVEALSDNMLPTVADLVKSGTSTEYSERKEKQNLNPKENLIVGRKVMSSEENLMISRKNMEVSQNTCVENLSDSDVTESHKSFPAVSEFHNVKTNNSENEVMLTSSKINKDTDSHISLNEMLDLTPEVSMKDFKYEFKKEDDETFYSACDKKQKKSKKTKKDKQKKSSKITLDKFLEDRVDVSQDYLCDKYFQRILNEQYKSSNFSSLTAGSRSEFPELKTEDLKFFHSDKKIKEKDVEVSYKNFRSDLDKCEEIGKKNIIDCEKIKSSMTDTKYGKLVIQNIPRNVTKDDISSILYGYGETKNLSLVSRGNFLTAYIEIDLICDMDWIIECLNGSEPFGASPQKLQCYKQ